MRFPIILFLASAAIIALLVIVTGLWLEQSRAKPKLITKKVAVAKPIKKLSNAELVNELGAPAAGIDCKALFGQAGLVGGLWADTRNARYVIVCAPGSAN